MANRNGLKWQIPFLLLLIAFHSPLMDPMLDEFAAVAESLTYSEPKIPIVSNVSGELLSAELATDPAYWVRHVREPVRFADALATVDRLRHAVLVEVGPGRTLSKFATMRRADARTVAVLQTGDQDAGAWANLPGLLWATGLPVEWGRWGQPTSGRRVQLPTYPFAPVTRTLSEGARVGICEGLIVC